jgi:hypothetical protein
MLIITVWHGFCFFSFGYELEYGLLTGFGALAVAGFVGLRLGQLWGWITIQVPFAFLGLQLTSILLSAFCSPSSDSGLRIAGALAVAMFGIPVLLIWAYLYTKKVRSFCSLTKSKGNSP